MWVHVQLRRDGGAQVTLGASMGESRQIPCSRRVHLYMLVRLRVRLLVRLLLRLQCLMLVMLVMLRVLIVVLRQVVKRAV